MKEKAISLNTKMEIHYDINNGLFSKDYEPSYKCYRDEKNELDIEVHTEYDNRSGEWVFDVTLTDKWGEEYILEKGQWIKLHDTLLRDIQYRNEEAESEAEHIAWLWRACV